MESNVDLQKKIRAFPPNHLKKKKKRKGEKKRQFIFHQISNLFSSGFVNFYFHFLI